MEETCSFNTVYQCCFLGGMLIGMFLFYSASASVSLVTATFTVPVDYTNDPTGYISSLGIYQGMPAEIL